MVRGKGPVIGCSSVQVLGAVGLFVGERGEALAEQRSELLNLTGPTLSQPLAARLWNPIQGIQTDKFQWMRMEIERHLAGSCEQPIQMVRLARPPAGALNALGQLDQGQLDPRSGHDVWLPYLPSHGRRGRHAGGRYGGEGHSSYCKPTIICPLPSSPSPLPFHQPNQHIHTILTNCPFRTRDTLQLATSRSSNPTFPPHKHLIPTQWTASRR